jgi:2-methylcitrate dehydratase PrpD
VFEGKFGFLEAYCRGADQRLLTANLGEEWKALTLSIKRFPCAMFAHSSVEGLRELISEHRFSGNDVARVEIEGAEKLVSHHNITEPRDIMQAQYSLPFCVSLAMFRDPDDPNSFVMNALDDPDIRAACRSKIEIRARDLGKRSGYSTTITVELKDGRRLTRNNDTFKGQPARPFTREELGARFMRLSAGFMEEGSARRLLAQLENLEAEPRFTLASYGKQPSRA